MDLIQEFNGLIFMASEIQEDVEAKSQERRQPLKAILLTSRLVTAAEKAG